MTLPLRSSLMSLDRRQAPVRAPEVGGSYLGPGTKDNSKFRCVEVCTAIWDSGLSRRPDRARVCQEKYCDMGWTFGTDVVSTGAFHDDFINQMAEAVQLVEGACLKQVSNEEACTE